VSWQRAFGKLGDFASAWLGCRSSLTSPRANNPKRRGLESQGRDSDENSSEQYRLSGLFRLLIEIFRSVIVNEMHAARMEVEPYCGWCEIISASVPPASASYD